MNSQDTLEIVVNSGSFTVFIEGFYAKNLSTWVETLRYCGTMGLKHVIVHTWHSATGGGYGYGNS
jgi:hypothetical protein